MPAVAVVNLTNPSVESGLVTQLRSLHVDKDDPEKEKKEKLLVEINNNLKELGANNDTFTVRKGNSIWCYFLCTTKEQLRLLRAHYESGQMTKVLMKIFTLLAGNVDVVMTQPLKWDSLGYNRSTQRLSRLIALGQ